MVFLQRQLDYSEVDYYLPKRAEQIDSPHPPARRGITYDPRWGRQNSVVGLKGRNGKSTMSAIQVHEVSRIIDDGLRRGGTQQLEESTAER